MQFSGPFAYIGPLATGDNLVRNALRVEELGFDFVWMGEHVYFPREMKARYPYTADGKLPVDADTNNLEIVSTLSFIAGQTSKLRFLTATLLPAVRAPYLAARQFAALDYLSKGRLTVGLGLGWMNDEYELAGVPWNRRGKYMDEWILALRAFTAGQAFKGDFFNFEEGFFAPTGAQNPLPLWIGGDSEAAMKRAAKFGSGWMPIGPFDLDEKCVWFKENMARIGEIRAGLGQSMDGFCLMGTCGYLGTERGANALHAAKSQLVDTVGRFAEAGVTHTTIMFNELNATDMDGVLEEAQFVAEEILPLFKAA